MKPKTASILLVAVLIGLVPTAGRAMFINVSEEVPLGRLLENVGAYVEAHPEDPQGHYVLARIHSMAFAREAGTLPVIPEKLSGTQGLPGFAPWDSIIEKRAAKPLTESAREHLLASIRHYGLATRYGPKRAIAHLGHGWMLENGAAFAPDLGAPPGEPEVGAGVTEEETVEWDRLLTGLGSDDYRTREQSEAKLRDALPRVLPLLLKAKTVEDPEVKLRIGRLLTRHWLDRALDAYRKAFELSIESDREKEYFGPAADSSISLEAGGSILRLLEKRERTHDEEKEKAGVSRAVSELTSKGMSITPIIFPLRRPGPLSSLLDPNRTVGFDLAGDGVDRRWPWVRPDTGILVWDPERTGRISSGRQLFGSSTWWVFWENGFAALASLDDDGSGHLTEGELEGIAVWTDRDGDGLSDPGEVRPATALGILSISVRPEGVVDGVPSDGDGIRMKDGRILPMYDWIVKSVLHGDPAIPRPRLRE